MEKDREIVSLETKRKTGRGGTNNFPQTQEPDEPGTNARYLRHALVALDLPPIDISDIDQCKQRASEYFMHCINNDMKPNIVGLCNWLGISRDTMHTWRTGENRGSTHTDFFKKCVSIMEEMNVEYFLDSKIHPTAGIFILKNHFGYRDVTDITLEPKQSISDISPEDVAAKYQELPE